MTAEKFHPVGIGHWTDLDAGTGCTVIVCPQGAVAGVDVAGGAPATRETDLLRPEKTVSQVHAVVLSGGSAYGLEASSGVMDELEAHGYGLDVGVARVPIVVSACLFDLACGNPHIRPDKEAGRKACKEALTRLTLETPRGLIGAGTGCTVGKLAGTKHAMKSGLGRGEISAGNVSVVAFAAVNALGDIFDPETHEPLAGIQKKNTLLCDSCERLAQRAATLPFERTNTTISCVVTNVRLTKAEATRLAQMAGDAYAHTIYPTHTSYDGDTVFVLSCGDEEADINGLGVLITQALESAIVDAVVSAHDAYGLPASSTLKGASHV